MRLGRSRLCAHASQASRRDCRRLVLAPGEEWSAVLCMPAPSQIGGLTTLAGPTEGTGGLVLALEQLHPVRAQWVLAGVS